MADRKTAEKWLRELTNLPRRAAARRFPPPGAEGDVGGGAPKGRRG